MYMPDYQSPLVAVMISATPANTQTNTSRYTISSVVTN